MTGIRNPGRVARQAGYYREHGKADIADMLESQLAGAGRCIRCGRALTDSTSLQRGVGPDCWAKQLDEAVAGHPAAQPPRTVTL